MITIVVGQVMEDADAESVEVVASGADLAFDRLEKPAPTVNKIPVAKGRLSLSAAAAVGGDELRIT